jgi:hypothetical protein
MRAGGALGRLLPCEELRSLAAAPRRRRRLGGRAASLALALVLRLLALLLRPIPRARHDGCVCAMDTPSNRVPRTYRLVLEDDAALGAAKL